MEVKVEIKQDRNEIDQKRQVRIEISCFTLFVESNIHQKSSHAPQCGKMKNLHSQKNSSNQLFSNFWSKNVTFTKFLSVKCARDSKFP